MRILNGLYERFWNGLVRAKDEKRMSKQKLPDGICSIVDVPYREDRLNEHLLDVYYPESAEGKLPVIIDMHGGGLMYGYKELNKNYCFHLASRGFAVFNVSYSLAPAHPFPVCLVDAMNAVCFIGEHFNLGPCDSERVFLVGDSAGALLAMHVAALCEDAELRAVYGASEPGFRIRAVGLISGMFYFDSGLARLLAPGIFGKGGFSKSPFRPYLAPESALRSGKFPPAHLTTSREDMIRSATLRFKKLLDAKGVACALSDFPRARGRKLEHVFSVLYPAEYPESVAAIDEMTAFFLRAA